MTQPNIHFAWQRIGGRFKGIFVHRKYKDRLFRKLFSDKRELLSLYNAIAHTDYTDPGALETVTRDNVIFMGMKNDLSFVIGSRLCMYEHQSTLNPNMPLRGLLYFASLFEDLAAQSRHSLYGERRIKLPTPEYIVFYNGKKDAPERSTYYLSDAFSRGRGSGCLECKCELINIGKGHNPGLMEDCHRLWEYAELIGRIDENVENGMDRKSAVCEAVDYCIAHDIMADILGKEKSAMVSRLLTEYNEKEHMEYVYEDGRREGEAIGRAAEQERIRAKMQAASMNAEEINALLSESGK